MGCLDAQSLRHAPFRMNARRLGSKGQAPAASWDRLKGIKDEDGSIPVQNAACSIAL